MAGRTSEQNLAGWALEKPHLDAVCGGLTSMASLLPGVERASEQPSVFTRFDSRANAHVNRMRQMREVSTRRGGWDHVGKGVPLDTNARALRRPGGAPNLPMRTPCLPLRREVLAGAAERRLAAPLHQLLPLQATAGAIWSSVCLPISLRPTGILHLISHAGESSVNAVRADGHTCKESACRPTPPKAATSGSSNSVRRSGGPRSLVSKAFSDFNHARKTSASSGPRVVPSASLQAERRCRAAEAAEARALLSNYVAE